MLQRLLEFIRRLVRRLISRLFGREEVIKPRKPVEPPTTPTTVEIPTRAITEPELGLASAEPPQYRRRESVLTYRERMFFKALTDDVGDRYQIFAKVRLGDIFWLANEPENRKFHNNQLQCKHFDFLLCEKNSHKPLLAIELDDSSHDKYEHHERDEFKERVCRETGLKLWRLRVQQAYPKGYVGEQVHGKIQEQTAK